MNWHVMRPTYQVCVMAINEDVISCNSSVSNFRCNILNSSVPN